VSLISKELADRYGATVLSLDKEEVIFREGDEANYFYQVVAGKVKIVTYSREGHEFIQGLFEAGESFGEPPLICNFPYPSSAYALTDCQVMRVAKSRFLDLLKHHLDVHLQFDRILCERLRYKNMILSEISFYDPEHRILSLLKYLKSKSIEKEGVFRVPLTRQQIADMSGMRVETVIRTIKRMEEEGKLQIHDRKILV
jgi:CRP/FNR family transcriptional regulator, cyclic AMP receptor protein